MSHLAVNCHSFESSLPFLKFTVNGITADFSYSVYSGVIQALLKNNPEVELGAPFAITGFTLHGRVVDEEGVSRLCP